MEADAIPETALVRLFDQLNRTTRRNWAEQGVLRKAPRGEGYKEHDAAELAAFLQLTRAEIGDFYETVAAWQGVREALKDSSTESSSKAGARLVAVIDGETKGGTLVTSGSDLGALLFSDARKRLVIRMVDLTDEVRVAREAFQRVIKARKLGDS